MPRASRPRSQRPAPASAIPPAPDSEPTNWTYKSQITGRKLDHYGLPPTPATSFLQLKFKSKNALRRWPYVTRWVPYETRRTEEVNEELNSTVQDGTEEEQTTKNTALDSACLGENDTAVDEHAANVSVQQPADQAPTAPADGADDAFHATAVQADSPPPAPISKPASTPRKGRNKAAMERPKRSPKPTAKAKAGLHKPAHRSAPQAKSILKPEPSGGIRKKPTKRERKAVVVDPAEELSILNDTPVSHNSNEENESPVASCTSDDSTSDKDSDAEMSDAPASATAKPSGLKLSFSRKPSVQGGGIQPAPVQTPTPQSTTARTPSIKLKLPSTSTPTTAVETGPKPKKQKKAQVDGDTIDVTPGSNKKRKRVSVVGEDDDEGGRPVPAPPNKPPTLRKLTFKNTQAVATLAAKPTGAAQLLFKVKGKVPKRPLGVGYDSELESEYQNERNETVVGREVDPVIHEGFVLRMQPGEDADYLRKSIEEGKAGEIISKGGAATNLRMLDTAGRRGILQIKDHRYATSLIDLPCIIEGMKSWDKRGWIKSVDICQMLLVLGRCKDEDDARNYPLPEDVDPHTYQYAHGLTAPMKWVRKRRFARTKRARVDDIEAIERRVHALLEADKAALSTRYQLLDHDLRLDKHGYSIGTEEDEEESDSEGEVDNYYDYHPGAYSVSEPVVTETPVQEEITQDDVDALERMFYAEDKVPATEPSTQAQSALQPPEARGDSSFAVTTTTSATPSASAQPTPAAEASSDEDEDDGGEDDEDRDDAEKEGDESKRQALERIEDMTNKISEQRELLKKTTNAILKKKLARKIADLEDDVAMMKKNAGLADGEDDE